MNKKEKVERVFEKRIGKRKAKVLVKELWLDKIEVNKKGEVKVNEEN